MSPRPGDEPAARIAAQLLSGPRARSVESVVHRLLAIQAQEARGARLAVRSRSTGLLAADVDDALSTRRSLIVTWLNRGTLHLVAADDYWWLHALTTPQLAPVSRRRLRQEGVSERQAARGVDVVVHALRAHGPQTRAQLRARLEVARVPTAGQALVHVLLAASLHGDVIRGPVRGSEQAFVAASDWLGDAPKPVERDVALGRLAQRYLRGHGPARAADLAKWAGITLGDARAALSAIAPDVCDRGDGLVDLADRVPVRRLPGPRLLGQFDPLLHGWESREMFVGEHRGIVTTNGIFRPFALVAGRAVATWGLAGGTLTIRPFEHFTGAVESALRTDAVDVFRFLGMPEKSAVVVDPAPGARRAKQT